MNKKEKADSYTTQSISGGKGQAAMEFLMTYGWAILAAVIVIGVLASFGVFSTSNYIPTTCSLTSPFGCDKVQVAADASANTLTFVVRNGYGSSLNVEALAVTGCTPGTVSPALPLVMGDQNTTAFTLTCGAGQLVASEKFTGAVTLTYRPIGGVLNLSASGSVTVKVAP